MVVSKLYIQTYLIFMNECTVSHVNAIVLGSHQNNWSDISDIKEMTCEITCNQF